VLPSKLEIGLAWGYAVSFGLALEAAALHASQGLWAMDLTPLILPAILAGLSKVWPRRC